MSPSEPREPGAQFLAEIREQPRALERLLEREADFARVAAIARERGTTIRLVGHGSSDNAAAYGMYAFGLLPGWTAMRDSITLSVYYKASVDMSGSTVIALSQSGQTRDVIEYVARARARRSLHDRRHERPGFGARAGGGGGARARRGDRAGGRGDEDVHEPDRGARPPRGARGRPGPALRRGAARGDRAARVADPGAGAGGRARSPSSSRSSAGCS